MSLARGRFNQKLYYAALQLRLLEAHSRDQQTQALLEAMGQSIQGHLMDAYGWLLLDIAALETHSEIPPRSLAQLDLEPADGVVRGEWVELRALEQDPASWLAALMAAPHHTVSAASGAAGVQAQRGQSDSLAVDVLASTAAVPWSLQTLKQWYGQMLALGERLGDSLDEW